MSNTEIMYMVQDYSRARDAKNWKEAARIHNDLKELQVVLTKTPHGFMWRREE